jgi:cytochrome c-type biogenesis protein
MLSADPVSYSVVFAAGFVSFASPCVLPLVPAYLGVVSGVGFDDFEKRRWAVFFPTLAFVAGFSLVFMALGASVGFAGTSLLQHRHTIEIAGGLFVIAMGLVLLGRGIPMFLMRDRRFHRTMRPATLVGAGLAGAAFAFGWTPCIGPTLGAALTLAAGSGSWFLGGSLLLVYGLGLGIPFLLAGLFVHQATSAMGILKRHIRLISQVGAVVLIVFGVLMVTGLMTQLNVELASLSPALM